MINGTIDLEWLDEEVDLGKSVNGLYKLACFLLRKKKLTYKDFYLISIGLNKHKYGGEKARERALQTILKAYKKNHYGKLPIGFKEKEEIKDGKNDK